MKRFLLALGCVLAVMPGVASAALSIAIGPDITVAPGAIPVGEQFFDLVFNETGTPANEGLFAYDLYIKRDKPGINLIRAEKPDNWVFTSPGASFSQAGPEFSHLPDLIVVNAIGDLLGANQDIVDGTKVARVFYTIDPATYRGHATVMLDQAPGTTVFVSGDTGEAIPVDLSDTGDVTSFIPEPGTISLLGVGGLLLRRRSREGAER
jgi:hypothetical protein